jgi:hypothetical protein
MIFCACCDAEQRGSVPVVVLIVTTDSHGVTVT